MPIYEYQCMKCGAIRTQIIPWSELKSDDGEAVAIKCEALGCDGEMVKVISAPAKPYVKW